MASKDSPSEQARNIEEAQEDDGEVEVPEEYKWLQEQLSAAMRVGAGEGEDEEAEGWQDPSGGILPHMLEVSEEGDAEKLEQLIAQLPADADINTHGPDGDTCLHVACLYGHQACVELLLAKGADANAVNSEDGSTALHDAAAGTL